MSYNINANINTIDMVLQRRVPRNVDISQAFFCIVDSKLYQTFYCLTIYNPKIVQIFHFFEKYVGFNFDFWYTLYRGGIK